MKLNTIDKKLLTVSQQLYFMWAIKNITFISNTNIKC